MANQISEKEICITNNNDHCFGLLRSGEGGSDKLVEHRLPNLPVQKLCTHRKRKKNMRILEHKQTNNNPTTMKKKTNFQKVFQLEGSLFSTDLCLLAKILHSQH